MAVQKSMHWVFSIKVIFFILEFYHSAYQVFSINYRLCYRLWQTSPVFSFKDDGMKTERTFNSQTSHWGCTKCKVYASVWVEQSQRSDRKCWLSPQRAYNFMDNETSTQETVMNNTRQFNNLFFTWVQLFNLCNSHHSDADDFL